MASRKGRPNVLSATARENIIAVFTRIGGTASMAIWAKRNRTEFYRLYARLIPQELSASVEISEKRLSYAERVAKERTLAAVGSAEKTVVDAVR